jgi:small-conductance mechanosensitive channel
MAVLYAARLGLARHRTKGGWRRTLPREFHWARSEGSMLLQRMTTRGSVRIALAAAALLAAARAGAVPPRDGAGEREAAEKAGGERPARSAPQPIPVEQVFRAADELGALLLRAEAAAEVDPAVEAVESMVTSAAKAVDRLRPGLELHRLEAASAREIDRLRQALGREALLLADGQALLEKRSGLLAGASRELQDRLASWKLTGEAAREEGAPEAVLRRVAQAEESLRRYEVRLRGRQELLFGLEGRVSDLRAELARMLASVDHAETVLNRQLFEAESAPLWRALARPDRTGTLGGQGRQALRESARDVTAFVREEPVRLWSHVAVVVALGLGLFALRRPVAAMAAGDPALRGAARMLSRPWSAALLLSLLVVDWLYGPLPPALKDLFGLVFLAPLLRLLPGLLPEIFRRPLYGLAALSALDKLAALAPPRTLLSRVAVLVVTSCAVAGLASGLRPGGWARFLRGGWKTATRVAAVTAFGLLVVSVVANVVGNATLAERLTRATLNSAILGTVVLGVQVVLEGAVAAVLHLPALGRRRIVARHRDLLRRRTVTLLRVGLVASWAWRTAILFGVAAAAEAAGRAVLALRLQVGGLDVSLGNVVAFGVTLVVAVALSRAVRFVLDEGVFAEIDLPRGIPAAVSTTVQYFLIVLGFSWAVLASGMEMSRFSFLVGALGVGIGFGLQNVVNNFVSGLILLYERPIQVGDIVEVGSVAGEVTRIGVRSSTVRTFPGAEVIVPNGTLISADVTNWTLSDRRRRIDLGVGVAYGTPPRQVIDLLLAAVRGRPGVLEGPAAVAPVALLLKFGESSIEFVLRFWTADFDRWQPLASEVLIEVYTALDRAGIEIPLPQRDLHVRSLDPAAARALAAAGTDAAARPDPAVELQRERVAGANPE